MTAPDHPSAFLSYARGDDRDGRLTAFVERLTGEVEMQLGAKFDLFRDKSHISWGQRWRERIDDSLNGVTFLVPIITPSYFVSEMCRSELSTFLTREEQLDRSDLVLPVYWIVTPLMQKPDDDELAAGLAERNYADWRDLRHEDFSSPEVGKRLAHLAEQLVMSLSVTPRPRPTTPPKPETPQVVAADPSSTTASTDAEPPTFNVDPMGRGTHITIAAAVNDAQPGQRIIVQPGVYSEELDITKPLEILGEGAIEDIVIQATSSNAIRFNASMGRIGHITLRQTSDDYYTVHVRAGMMDLFDCVITTKGLSPIAVSDSAHASIRNSRITGTDEGTGVWTTGASFALVEDCEIERALHGLSAEDNSELVARRNRIADSEQNGVYLTDSASATLEDNQILSSNRCGVAVTGKVRVTALRNRITNSAYEAIELIDAPGGRIAENDLRGNDAGPWDQSKYVGDSIVILDNIES